MCTNVCVAFSNVPAPPKMQPLDNVLRREITKRSTRVQYMNAPEPIPLLQLGAVAEGAELIAALNT